MEIEIMGMLDELSAEQLYDILYDLMEAYLGESEWITEVTKDKIDIEILIDINNRINQKSISNTQN